MTMPAGWKSTNEQAALGKEENSLEKPCNRRYF